MEPEKSRAARAGLLHARNPHRAHRSFKQSSKNGRRYHKAGPRHRAFRDRQEQKGRRPKPTPSVLEFRPLLEGRRPSPGSLGSFLVGPETDLDFLLIEDFFAGIVIFSQEAS